MIQLLRTIHWNSRPIKQENGEPSSKKIKKEIKNDPEAQELENTITKQNKEYFKIRDALSKKTNKAIWLQILDHNKQAVPSGKSEVWALELYNESANKLIMNIFLFF